MQLPNFSFIFYFLPFIITVYFIFSFSLSIQNQILLVSSLLLYAWGQPVFIFVLMTSIVCNWVTGNKITECQLKEDQGSTNLMLFVGIIFNLGILIFCKYSGMLKETFFSLIGRSYGGLAETDFPMGVSFFTLMAISYLVDIYRREVESPPSPLDLGLYLSLFPIQAAGPLLHYKDIAPQIRSRKTTWPMFSNGFSRFIIGLAKSVILAKIMGDISTRIFSLSGNALLESLPALLALVGLVALTFHLYYYFSGLADIAIGLGSIFGFTFKENFKYPYAVATMTDFWRTWNISVVIWFRNYVFTPLRRQKAVELGTDVANSYNYGRDLLVVSGLFGLWYGPGLNFCAWGLFHGLFLLFEAIFKPYLDKTPYLIRRVYVAAIVMTGWVLFGASSLHQAMIFFKNLLGLNNNGFYSDLAGFYIKENLIFFIAAIVASQPIVPAIKLWLNSRAGIIAAGCLRLITPFVLMALFFLSIIYMVQGTTMAQAVGM